MGLEDPGPPRARPHRGSRDHHRAPRPGGGERGRDGDGRPPPARPAGPRRPGGQEPLRPPRLRDLQRRRPRGGRQLRGLLARRSPAAGQPHPDLRRQRDLDRGRHRHRVQRGRRQALRGLRLARPDDRLDQRRPRVRRGRRRRLEGPREGREGHRQAEPDPAPDDHRLAGPERPEHRQGARLRAGRRRGGRHQGAAGLGPRPDLPGARRRAGPHPRAAGARRRGRRGLGRGVRRAGPSATPSATSCCTG